MLSEKYHYFIYVSSEMDSMTTCDKSGIKAVYNYEIKILLLHELDKM